MPNIWSQITKNTKDPYLPYMKSGKKNKGTLFSSTFKVEENKVPLFLWSDANLVSYGYYLVLHGCRTSDYKKQKLERSISPLYKARWKKEKHFFSSTFKVEENKVPLFSWSDANLVSYGYFVVLHGCRLPNIWLQNTKARKVHISLI